VTEDDAWLAQRIVVLRGAIDDQHANESIAKLLFLEHEARLPIRLHLDSLGGGVANSLAIRDTIDDLTVPVYTHVRGRADGVAVVLLAHGARGHRTASPNARMSLTPITSERSPIDADELTRTTAILVEMLAADTGQLAETIAADMRAGRRFDAVQARDYGLVDQIVP
jgi:ATP-dependent Clp protease, protease subunit